MDLYTIRNELMLGKSIYDLNLRVTFYTRVSTGKDEQLNSLKNQIDYFKEYIKNQPNWEYVEGYIDEAISGTQTNKREAFNQMIEDGRNKKFDLILTKEVSRFARNTLDSIFYTRELLKNGVGVFFTNDNINTLFPDSELRLTIMSSIAQEESRKISERVKWGKKRAMENGRIFCNSRFWGYDLEDGKLIINELEAQMVRKIFDLYCSGYGIRKVAEIISQEYKNHNNRPFNFTSIRNIISNPRYKGYFTARKTSTVDYIEKERKFLKPEEWIMYYAPEIVPPIVSEEIWEKANRMLKEKAEKLKEEVKTSYQNKYLYSGKIYCGEHNVTYWRTLFKYDTIEDKEVWQCKVYRKQGKKSCDSPIIYKHELDIIVKNVIKELFVNKEYHINKLIDIYKKYIQDIDHDKDIKDLMKKISAIEKKKEKILELNIEGILSNKEFEAKNNKYNEEISLLNEQIKKYEKMNDMKYNAEDQLNMIKKILEKNIDFENTDDISDEVIQTFLDKIIVYKGSKENEVKLNVVLKPAIEVKTIFRRNMFENMHLLLTLHMNSSKLKFKFTRNSNNQAHKPYDIDVNVESEFKLFA